MKTFGKAGVVSRRFFLKTMASAAAGAFLGYGGSKERENLQIVKRAVALTEDRRMRLRLAHISDLHMFEPTPWSFLAKTAAVCRSLQPDLICLTGDYISAKIHRPNLASDFFRTLVSIAPVYACLGNHDGGLWAGRFGGYSSTSQMRDFLGQAGVTVLHNASARAVLPGGAMTIVGVADPWSGEMDPAAAFAAQQGHGQHGPHIVLCHNPDAKDELGAYPWDLLLCGHTHGGQLIFPLLGIAPFAPIGDRSYAAGLRRWGARQVHTTTGIASMLGVRVNCPPEIALIHLS